jgi:drug/metabolite transporter (DMT)-like permease
MSRDNNDAKVGSLAMWMTGALLSFCVAALSVRELSKFIGVFDIMVFRSATGVLFLTTLALLRPDLRAGIDIRELKLHGLRSGVHFVANVCWTLSITLLPLATVFAIEFTMPAWVAVFAMLFLSERLTVGRVGGIAICFAGVLVLVRPGLGTFQPATLLVVVVAITVAVTLVITKRLVATQSTFAILFWMNLMQLPMNLSAGHLSWLPNVEPAMLLPLAGLAVTGLSTHWCLANAFRHADATVVVPLDFLRVPLIAVIGWLLYGEPIDAFVFGGAGLIITGVLWTLQTETRQPVPARA